MNKNKKFNPNCRPANYLNTVWYGRLLPAKYVFAASLPRQRGTLLCFVTTR